MAYFISSNHQISFDHSAIMGSETSNASGTNVGVSYRVLKRNKITALV